MVKKIYLNCLTVICLLGIGIFASNSLAVPESSHSKDATAAISSLTELVPPSALATDAQKGQWLVEQVFVAMKEGRLANLDHWTSASFQSIHQDGSRNKQEELVLIKNLHLSKYVLNDFKVTRTGNILIVTCYLTGGEIVNGKYLDNKSSPRLDFFMQTANGWQWLAHASSVILVPNCQD
jgi:hypothetical protein